MSTDANTDVTLIQKKPGYWMAGLPLGFLHVRQVPDEKKFRVDVTIGDATFGLKPRAPAQYFGCLTEIKLRAQQLADFMMLGFGGDPPEQDPEPAPLEDENDEPGVSRVNSHRAMQSDVFEMLGADGALTDIGQIKDADGNVAGPKRTQTLLDVWVRTGRISDEEYQAAITFGIAYRKAGQASSQACDPARIPGGGFNEYATLRKIDRGTAVWKALVAIGGWQTPAGLVACRVLGEGESLRQMDRDHGMDRVAVSWLLKHVCQSLAEHYKATSATKKKVMA